jgi:hypothetical protein
VCRYRTLFEGLGEVRSSCDAAVEGLAAAKQALLAGFDAWAAHQGQQVRRSSAACQGSSQQVLRQGGLTWQFIGIKQQAAADMDESLWREKVFTCLHVSRAVGCTVCCPE